MLLFNVSNTEWDKTCMFLFSFISFPFASHFGFAMPYLGSFLSVA